jgi:PAS domain S-box-containing protein
MPVYLFLGFAVLAGFILGLARAHSHNRASKSSGNLPNFEPQYYSTLDYASIGMASLAIDNGFIEANQAFCAMVGYSKQQLEQLAMLDVLHPDDLAVNLFNAERMLKRETDSFQIETRYRRNNGDVIWVLQTESLLHDGDGQPLVYIIQAQDITERKQTEQTLRNNEYLLRRMLDNVPARISYWNSELRNEFANNGYEEWFGFPPNRCAAATCARSSATSATR